MGVKKSKKSSKKVNTSKTLFSQGEAKPLIIAVIAIVAVLALSLLLIFSNKLFVGKAYGGSLNTIGYEAETVDFNTPFSITVGANIDKETVAVGFELDLPLGIDCNNVQSLLGWDSSNGAVLEKAECDNVNHKITFQYATVNSALSHTGTFDIAKIDFNGADAQDGSFTFNNVEIDDLETSTPVTLTTVEPTIQHPQYSCTGTIEHSTLCTDDDVDLQQDTAVTLVADSNSCTSTKCEVYCDSGYEISDGQCVEIMSPVCGDGLIEGTETCDDSNTDGGDGCSSICLVESGYTCSGEPSTCQVTPGIEICNDGIDNDNDGNRDCRDTDCIGDAFCMNLRAGRQCVDDADCSSNNCIDSICKLVVCGDGVIDTGEQCDGADLNSQTCQTQGFDSGTLSCDNSCNFDTSSCASAVAISGTKISLINVDSGNDFATKITATEDFSGTEITIWTILYDANDKVLSIKSEKVPVGLAVNGEYTATSNYPAANVAKKSVIVYDVEQSPTVYGELAKDY